MCARQSECSAEKQNRKRLLIFRVGVARFGNDSTVIFKRQGLVTLSRSLVRNSTASRLPILSPRTLTRISAKRFSLTEGLSQGVINHLRRSLVYKVNEVPFDASAIDVDAMRTNGLRCGTRWLSVFNKAALSRLVHCLKLTLPYRHTDRR